MRKLVRNVMVNLLLFCCLIALPSAASAAITVVAEPGSDPARVAMIQKTADAFNGIVSAELGVTLDRDVRIFVCPTRDNYRDILQREFGLGPEEAGRIAKITSGFSKARAKAVAVNMDLPAGAPAGYRAYYTTAHELFHQLQSQLAGDKQGKSYYWMKEGTADLIGAAVAEKVGHQSMDKWKLDRVNTLRKADKYAPAEAILTTSLDKWTTLIEEKLHPYEMADLMVFYLQERSQTGIYRGIAEYFRLLGQGVANEAAFERSFGITGPATVTGFQNWFAGIVTQSATVEIIAGQEVSADSAAEFQQGVDLTRRFFTEYWGRDIKSAMRFVLVSGKPAFAAAAVREFGVSDAAAREKVKTISWWYLGSTTICDIGASGTKRQRLFSVAGSLTRRFANETAPQKNMEEMYWLLSGSGSAAAAYIVELNGNYTREQYRASLLGALAKAPSRPALADLVTAAGVTQAKAKYGSAAVNDTMFLAGLYLLDKYGPSAFADWYKAVKETGNAGAAFQKVFGLSAAQFYEEFAAYLAQNIKKAA